MTLRRVIVQADRLESGVDVLRQMRERPVTSNDLAQHVGCCWRKAKRVRRQSTLPVGISGSTRDETHQTAWEAHSQPLMGATATTLARMEEGQNHLITCPSGTQVTITPAGHPALIEAGTIPNNLVEAAIRTVKGTTRSTASSSSSRPTSSTHRRALGSQAEADRRGRQDVPVEDRG